MGVATNISKRLARRIDSAISGRASYFSPQVILSNPESGMKTKINVVKSLYIVQDFTTSFMDSVKCTIEVDKEQYDLIKENAQDLECRIILTPIDPTTLVEGTEEMRVIYEFMVMFTDQIDAAKVAPASAFGDPETGTYATAEEWGARFDIDLPLITKKMHDLKNSSCPVASMSGSVEDLLRWSCTSLGCTEVNVVTPEVQSLPANFQIPKAVEDPKLYYDYIKSKCNIYSKGLSIYFSDDTATIFPTWDTDKSTSPQTTIINIINGSGTHYEGLSSYHHVDTSGDIDILVVGKVKYSTPGTAAAENFGTGVVIQDACSSVNYGVKVESNGSSSYSNQMQVITSQNTSANASSSMQRMKYGGSTADVYSLTEQLAKSNGAMLQVPWACAYPGLIKPGHNVVYHYDEPDQTYSTKNGRVTRVAFSSQLGGITNGHTTLHFDGSIEVFLEPETASEATTQQLSQD